MRATWPPSVSPLRMRICARCPIRNWPSTDSSTRMATHSVAGSTSFRIGEPVSTVLPGSAWRWITMPSIGASRRV